MPLFVCAGMIRSGSTWLYNAMRLLLLREYPALRSSTISERDATVPGPELVKLHHQDQSLADRADIILTCHRDLRDIAMSVQSVGWLDDPERILRRLRTSRANYDFWAVRSSLDIAYADIAASDVPCLRRISKALSVEAGDDTIHVIADTLRAVPNNRTPDKSHDAEFLTHTNHRNDGRAGRWRGQLPPDLAHRIFDEHRDWMEQRGYTET